LLETWSKVTGKPSAFLQVNLEEYSNLWPMWGLEMGVMTKFWGEVGDKSWSGENFLTSKALGIEESNFATIEETFRGMNWNSLL
jgi:hypothetical protein